MLEVCLRLLLLDSYQRALLHAAAAQALERCNRSNALIDMLVGRITAFPHLNVLPRTQTHYTVAAHAPLPALRAAGLVGARAISTPADTHFIMSATGADRAGE